MKKRLLVCTSSHGFGHFAMTTPIINQLLAEDQWDITLRTTIPKFLIESRISQPITVVAEATDFGMQMNSSLDVDREESAKAYRQLHKDWDQQLEIEQQKLSKLAPDLLLSNIPYLTLAAAAQLQIPALAYCSLNWADIAQHYFLDQPDFVEQYIPTMLDAYNSAQQFLCPAPSMAMPALENKTAIGPVCNIGTPQREALDQHLGLDPQSRLVLISVGGVATPILVDSWPEIPGIVWICAWSYQSQRSDIFSIDDFKLGFTDLMASVDAVITKPGYGTVTEAVCHGKPALYVRRGDWAEEPFLVDWWQQHGICEEISRSDFFQGHFKDALFNLLNGPRKPSLTPEGIKQAVDIINKYL